MYAGAITLVLAVAGGMWLARDRRPVGPVAQRVDPQVELPEGWDLPPPTTKEVINGPHRPVLPILPGATGSGGTLRWQFRVELPVEESRCGSGATVQPCAQVAGGPERVAVAVISGSRTLVESFYGDSDLDRIFRVDRPLPAGAGYFQFVRVKRDWVRVSDPQFDQPVFGVTITPPATSLRAISGRLWRTTDLSPPRLGATRALFLARRWLTVDSPLEVELVAAPQSQNDRRITRLCYLAYDTRVRLWIDAHTGRPYHGYCSECPKALEERVEQLAKHDPDVFAPPRPP
ncbi:MAG: hypothetical protein KF718_33165 [Polyangiaceae bacterium]|nr:hypothetical protein [Polyangiaceae bacterium]